MLSPWKILRLCCRGILKNQSLLNRASTPINERLQTISEQLIEEGIVNSVQAANSTASYYFKWLQGIRFDLKKSAVKIHRARLRKLHIDIAETCDITKHSAIRVKAGKEIEVFPLEVPDWYELPQLQPHLRLVS